MARLSAEIINRKQSSQDRPGTLADRIVQSIDRCDRMLKDLLDSARLESGQTLSPKFVKINLSEVLTLAIQNVKASIGARREIRLHCPGELSGDSNPDFLLRITENLLSNAIKYGSEGHSITVTGEKDADGLKIIVHNWGNTIPKDEIGGLFELYSHQASVNQRILSWGVGLTAVKSLTTSLGGKVEVQSTTEEGTAFTIKLPFEDYGQS